jgi:hypothetical protein
MAHHFLRQFSLGYPFRQEGGVTIAMVGVDLGKNGANVFGLDNRGAVFSGDGLRGKV